MDRGEASSGAARPVPYSAPREIDVDPARPGRPIALDRHSIPPPPDTSLRQARAHPERAADQVLGRLMHLGANVLLPEADAHPDALPLVISHGHFPHDFGGFRETPPDPT